MMLFIEVEYITSLLLLVSVIILLVIAAWFVARRKYKDYVKVQTVEEIQESIDILNKIMEEEKEKLAETIKLESKIAALETKIYFLSKYNCLNINCPKRNPDHELIEWADEMSEKLVEKTENNESLNQ